MQKVEDVLRVVEQAVYATFGEHLNDLQRVILRESWQEARKTYEQIAADYNYSSNYIQQVAAPKLWRLLSEAFGQKISKSNLHAVLDVWLAEQMLSLSQSITPFTIEHASASMTASAQLECPNNSVPLNSPFYIQRSPHEPHCYQSVLQTGALLRIKAPRQMGKTSLMIRVLAQAKAAGYQTVTLNFQQAEKAILADLHKLLRWLCANITQQLKLASQLAEYWDEDIGGKMNCTLYIEECVLEELNTPLVLVLEEVNELFEYPTVAQECLTMLRTWHEHTKTDSTWHKLRLILVQSTETYISLNINQSPFNVGLEVSLTRFVESQVQELVRRHDRHFTIVQLQSLMQLTEGHPYLVRLMLYHLAQQQSFDALLDMAPTDMGIYSDHLHRHLWNLQHYPELGHAFRAVLQSTDPIELEQVKAFKLQSMGLITLSGNRAAVACDLYRKYFCDRFLSQPDSL